MGVALLRTAAEEGYAISTAPGAVVAGPYGWRLLGAGGKFEDAPPWLGHQEPARRRHDEHLGAVVDIPTSDLVRELRAGTRTATTISEG